MIKVEVWVIGTCTCPKCGAKLTHKRLVDLSDSSYQDSAVAGATVGVRDTLVLAKDLRHWKESCDACSNRERVWFEP